jgi:NAD(P)-dependent dehydrogenase (short-subunit alcohol dehydrogenase family)
VNRLQNKVALITGAGTGMGRACAVIFAAEGARVLGTSRRVDPLLETKSLAEEAGGVMEVVQADVSDEAQARALVERTRELYGRIDILVNSAGMGGALYRSLREGGMESIAETPTEHWHELMKNNLDSVFFMCKAVIEVMRKEGGGSIVNIGSTSAIRGMSRAHAYAVTKAGVQSITRSMAARYGRDNIRTNCVCPGTTDTPMMVGSPSMEPFREDNPERFAANPLGRAGTPEEIAYGCLFLASDEASYVNGVILPIDGGALCCPA